MSKQPRSVLPTAHRVEKSILQLRGEQVMLVQDLAVLYGVATKQLLQAVKRTWTDSHWTLRFPLPSKSLRT